MEREVEGQGKLSPDHLHSSLHLPKIECVSPPRLHRYQSMSPPGATIVDTGSTILQGGYPSKGNCWANRNSFGSIRTHLSFTRLRHAHAKVIGCLRETWEVHDIHSSEISLPEMLVVSCNRIQVK